MTISRKRCLRRRRGNFLVLTAFLMIGLFGLLAFSIDLGAITVARAQLQRAADAGALAGAWDLCDATKPNSTISQATKNTAFSHAGQFVSSNKVFNASATLSQSDVEFGYLANPADPNSPFQANTSLAPNAVRVRVRRSSQQNGPIPLFFAKALGKSNTSSQADATAAFVKSMRGIRAPADGGNVDLLPYALDVDTWNNLLAGTGTDNWRWNETTKTVTAGADGVLECNLFPQGTGSPGNRGTVDIGSSNNSTADIARQILHGVSASDLAYHGGKLELGSNGQLELNGDTGISAGVKDELASIKGKPRIIPIFSRVTGPGNNAEYTIVKFAGVRIMEVQLTGKLTQKRVIIQPAKIMIHSGIPSSTNTSDFVVSPVRLVR